MHIIGVRPGCHQESPPSLQLTPTGGSRADDQALVRGGLRLIIESEPDMEVVAEAGDGSEAVHEAVRTRPTSS